MENSAMNQENMNETEKFLCAVGILKKQKENFLSDVVRAVCLYDEHFLKEFFKFCFPNKKEVKVYSIDREITCFSKNVENKKGRNDFKVYTSDGVYIVESKILDTDVSKHPLYIESLKIAKDKIAYIISDRNPEYNPIKRKLKSDCIACVCWEDFVKEVNSRYKDFTLVASAILNRCIIEAEKPKIEDMSKEKNLCDEFFLKYLKNNQYDNKGGNKSEWNCKGGYAYGYTIWASVWFGLIWSPLKGCFWSFAYGKGGDKRIKNETYFKRIKPLGKYMNDNFFYYEINLDNSEVMTEKILKSSFLEFADIIEVYDGNNNQIPFFDYIKQNGAKIER